MNTDYIRESNAIEGVFQESEIELSLKAWKYLSKVRAPLKIEHILECHRLIMKNLWPRIAGKFRVVDIQVGNDTDFPSCKDIKSKMDHFITINRVAPPKDALEALSAHLAFEAIHPFRDGNGRTGRMIYWWHCHQLGLTPILFTAKDVQGYYSLFQGK